MYTSVLYPDWSCNRRHILISFSNYPQFKYAIEITGVDDGGIHIASIPYSRGKSPSVGGGLPLLLLSVLPPVIPRASWPSSEHCAQPLRRGVTFSSQPKLADENSISTKPHTDEEDDYYRERGSISFNEPTTKQNVFSKLRSMLASKSNRKQSTGIAAALKMHMGYFSGLVPANKSGSDSLESSCNNSKLGISRCNESLSGNESDSRSFRKFSLAALCRSPQDGRSDSDGSNEVDGEDSEEDEFSKERGKSQTRSVPSLSQRVSFSIQHQHSQPVLNFRERARGSPRFPHRIVPTSSLSALSDRRKSTPANDSSAEFTQRRRSHFITPSKHDTNIVQVSPAAEKCRSLEDASTNLMTVPAEKNRAKSDPAWPIVEIENRNENNADSRKTEEIVSCEDVEDDEDDEPQ
ncbi:hypothetical protein LSTR_LSTR014619 [Laodelphax striatellus]|uniref:Uncharacterized protein n=1 Tax=Laodelphax striatellus TaxID=195883 RepID=A0A482XJ22_LAOST|nr:hypothetical protein LSTR_LSTR014619 [Laodelphax striatellus]